MYAAIRQALAGSAAVVGLVGAGIFVVVQAVSGQLASSQARELREFKDRIDRILTEYIETDLAASENALYTTRARETRLRAMIEYQRQLIKKTEEGVEQEEAAREQELLKDSEGLNQR